MTDVHAATDWLANRAAHDGDAPGRACILAEQGRGDMARAIALAAAITATGDEAPITLVGHYDGTMAKHDMAHAAMQLGVIADYIEAPTPGGVRLDRGDLIHALMPHFAVLWDAMAIPVKTYHTDVQKQHEADLRLAPYRAIYDGHPFDGWRLRYIAKSWAEIVSMTTGYDLTSHDEYGVAGLACACPHECAPWPEPQDIPPGGSLEALMEHSGKDDASLGVIPDGKPYVVVHMGAGGNALTKIVPKPVMDAIVKKLEASGYPCVQVGIDGEQYLPAAWKRMGLRLPHTVSLLRNAVALVSGEGFLPYLAQGVATSAAVLFAMTPYETYALPGNLNILPGLSVWRPDELPVEQRQKVGKPRACPMATCFWGCQWTWGENWAKECRLRYYGMHNPCHPECMNYPRPDDAAKVVCDFVKQVAAAKESKKATIEAA